MRSAAAMVVAALVAGGCAATAPHAGKGAGVASAPLTATSNPTGAKGGSPSPVAGVVAPSVRCVARPAGAPMVLVGNAIYEVEDAVHPRLLCVVANTKAHLFTGDTFEYVRRSGDTGTEVVLHSIGSGNESVVSGWPFKLLDDRGGVDGDWTADGDAAAALVPAIDGAGRDVLQVWLFKQPDTTILYQYLTPKDPGRSAPTLAFSADGQYLVTGWPASPSSYPLFVFRLGVHDPVQTLDAADTTAVWSRTGHTLYLSPGPSRHPRSWTPEGGFTPLAVSAAWDSPPSVSPDGTRIAFAVAGASEAEGEFDLATYDFASQASAALPIKTGTPQVTFVNDGWLWYFGSGSAIFAYDLAKREQQPVVFGPGQSPADLAPALFWPNA